MPTRLGKILGLMLGFAFGGPKGALIGFVLGWLYDNSARRVNQRVEETRDWASHNIGNASTMERATYTIGIIVLGAKMAKADGRVSREEIDAFKRVFNIPPEQTANVGQMFDQAKQSAGGYEPYAARLAQVFRHNTSVLEEILSGLCAIAAADTPQLSAAETLFLQNVAMLFGFNASDFTRIAARSGVHPAGRAAKPEAAQNAAYDVLGVTPAMTDEEIKKTYRALIRKHHPDKLAAQGLPPELLSQATEKMKRINAAYDSIAKARGFK